MIPKTSKGLSKRQKRAGKVIEFKLLALELLSGHGGRMDGEHLRRMLRNHYRAQGSKIHFGIPELVIRMQKLSEQGFVNVIAQKVRGDDKMLDVYTYVLAPPGIEELAATRPQSPVASPAPASPA